MLANQSTPIYPLTKNSTLTWLEACQWLESQGEAYCIATIIAEAGSVPRATGSKMVVSLNGQYDTLGGGSLERQVIEKARKKLTDSLSLSQNNNISIERFSLAADLGQCCGGAVQVLLEPINGQQPKVVIYGAGHVSQALCSILKQLPCHVSVIDNRQEWVDQVTEMGIQAFHYDTPVETIDHLHPNSLLLIMTHDHVLDFELTKLALEKATFPYIGLIGSQGKKQRFEFRLKEHLSDASLVKNLTCPIGHPDIKGKLPMQVAVSVSAQLMPLIEPLKIEQTNEKEATRHKENQWQKANITRISLKEAQDG